MIDKQYTGPLTQTTRDEIDHWVAKYPENQKRSAVLSALHAAQRQNDGWLSEEMMDGVAAYLQLPKIQVYEVATFYDMYDLKPCGKHKIRVCTNISCMLNGSEKILCHLKKRLGVEVGGSTDDKQFVLKEAECLAACVNAPMMQIDDVYYENLTPERVDEILQQWGDK